jgi:hypothetical protein
MADLLVSGLWQRRTSKPLTSTDHREGKSARTRRCGSCQAGIQALRLGNCGQVFRNLPLEQRHHFLTENARRFGVRIT